MNANIHDAVWQRATDDTTPPAVISAATINAEAIVPPEYIAAVRDLVIDFWRRGNDAGWIAGKQSSRRVLSIDQKEALEEMAVR